MNSTVDLIERLDSRIRKASGPHYHDPHLVKDLREVITALSLVMPDEVSQTVEYLRGSNLGSLQKAADLLEREYRWIQSLKRIIDEQQQRIEELDAANKDKSQLLASFKSQRDAARKRIEELTQEFENYKSWEDENEKLESQRDQLAEALKGLANPLDCEQICDEAKHPDDWYRAMVVYARAAYKRIMGESKDGS